MDLEALFWGNLYTISRQSEMLPPSEISEQIADYQADIWSNIRFQISDARCRCPNLSLDPDFGCQISDFWAKWMGWTSLSLYQHAHCTHDALALSAFLSLDALRTVSPCMPTSKRTATQLGRSGRALRSTTRHDPVACCKSQAAGRQQPLWLYRWIQRTTSG